MAVTHADLAPTPKMSSTDVGSKTGAFLIILSILLGLLCFTLSLVAEAARSKVQWMEDSKCTYSGSGKLPLLSATAAFVALALAMVVHHTFLLIAVSQSDSLFHISWDPHSSLARSFTCQAAFFFITTWISFALGEILLLIGLSIESGHLNNWETPRPTCLAIPQGLFTSAGVFGLITVFFASALYTTALRIETHARVQENTRREILEASIMYASPPRSPQRIPITSEETISRHDESSHSLNYYLTAFDKQSRLV